MCPIKYSHMKQCKLPFLEAPLVYIYIYGSVLHTTKLQWDMIILLPSLAV